MRTLFGVAPGFRLEGGWPARLSVGSPWLPATEEELAALVGDPAPVLLFQLPTHLREAFYSILARGLPQDEAAAYFADVAKFLEYKRLAPPPGSIYEAVATRPGEASEPGWGAANLGDEATHAVFDAGGTLVRLRLEAGQGYMLVGADSPSVRGDTEGKTEPEVLLRIG